MSIWKSLQNFVKLACLEVAILKIGILRQEVSLGSKKQVWLISKSNLSWSLYILRNHKIFVYDKNITRQSFGVLVSPKQNIVG